MKRNNSFTVGSLFAGIGGICLGFKQAGFDLSWANEIDSKACITYRKNFNHLIIEDDMKNVNPKSLKRVSVLTAGFPCQPFSIAGYRKGFEDDRGNLFFDVLKFIDELSPPILFLENVKNLQTHDDGGTFAKILAELEQRGYFIKYKVLNTFEYSNIPQNRERIYILCFKDEKMYNDFCFPEKKSFNLSIKDFLESEVDEKYYYNNSRYFEILSKEMKRTDTVYQWRRVYVRENKNGLCPTLTANMGTGGHNVPLILDSKGIRKLTPRECLRFQGFQDDYILPENIPNSALYKQAGNSVSVPIIYLIAKELQRVILNNPIKEKELVCS